MQMRRKKTQLDFRSLSLVCMANHYANVWDDEPKQFLRSGNKRKFINIFASAVIASSIRWGQGSRVVLMWFSKYMIYKTADFYEGWEGKNPGNRINKNTWALLLCLYSNRKYNSYILRYKQIKTSSLYIKKKNTSGHACKMFKII